MNEQQHHAEQLIKQYINIANDALRQQKNNAALKNLVALMQSALAGDDISIQVSDENARPIAHFSTRFADGQFAAPRSGEHGASKQFEVAQAYLQEVVDNAEEYMKHPTKLDWDWLSGQITPTDKNE